ncbi:MAG TPA: hypothetical protein VGC79_16120 [Polyangiaceae bacterium]
MKCQLLTLSGLLVALSASCFVRSALGDPDGTAPSESEGRAAERTNDSPAANPKVDPLLLARLQQLQTTRRAARKEALKDAKSWEEQRAERASAHRAQLAALWGAVVGSLDGQARLRTHAMRMASLNRMLDLAEQKSDAALVVRIQADIQRELTRHVQVMQELQAASGTRGMR